KQFDIVLCSNYLRNSSGRWNLVQSAWTAGTEHDRISIWAPGRPGKESYWYFTDLCARAALGWNPHQHDSPCRVVLRTQAPYCRVTIMGRCPLRCPRQFLAVPGREAWIHSCSEPSPWVKAIFFPSGEIAVERLMMFPAATGVRSTNRRKGT